MHASTYIYIHIYLYIYIYINVWGSISQVLSSEAGIPWLVPGAPFSMTQFRKPVLIVSINPQRWFLDIFWNFLKGGGSCSLL